MATDRFLGRKLLGATRLARWERRITRAVNAALSRHETHALGLVRTTVASAMPDLFNLDGWDASVGEEVGSVIEGVLADAANASLQFLSLPAEVRARILGSLDVEHQAASFIDRIKGVGPTIAQRLREAFTEGLSKGESISDLTARVEDCFRMGRDNAETIARTEVHGSAMQAGAESAQALHDSGVLLYKQWLTYLDDRTRDEHADANEQTVPMDQPFVVGGEELDYPGDPSGSAENVVNCRCDVLYDTAEAFGEATDAPSEGEAA